MSITNGSQACTVCAYACSPTIAISNAKIEYVGPFGGQSGNICAYQIYSIGNQIISDVSWLDLNHFDCCENSPNHLCSTWFSSDFVSTSFSDNVVLYLGRLNNNVNTNNAPEQLPVQVCDGDQLTFSVLFPWQLINNFGPTICDPIEDPQIGYETGDIQPAGFVGGLCVNVMNINLAKFGLMKNGKFRISHKALSNYLRKIR